MKKTIEDEPVQERIYNNESSFDTDLFKLEIAPRLKNIAYGEGADPDYVKEEHTHWFHTYDSDGKPHDKCVPTGGHFHIMTLTWGKKGSPPKVQCSPPMKEVRDKRGQKKIVPVGAYDQHIHKITYVRSHKVMMRQANAEAAKVHAMEEQKGAPVPGVNG